MGKYFIFFFLISIFQRGSFCATAESTSHAPALERTLSSIMNEPYYGMVIHEAALNSLIDDLIKNPKPELINELQSIISQSIALESNKTDYLKNTSSFIKLFEAYENIQHKIDVIFDYTLIRSTERFYPLLPKGEKEYLSECESIIPNYATLKKDLQMQLDSLFRTGSKYSYVSMGASRVQKTSGSAATASPYRVIKIALPSLADIQKYYPNPTLSELVNDFASSRLDQYVVSYMILEKGMNLYVILLNSPTYSRTADIFQTHTQPEFAQTIFDTLERLFNMASGSGAAQQKDNAYNSMRNFIRPAFSTLVEDEARILQIKINPIVGYVGECIALSINDDLNAITKKYKNVFLIGSHFAGAVAQYCGFRLKTVSNFLNSSLDSVKKNNDLPYKVIAIVPSYFSDASFARLYEQILKDDALTVRPTTFSETSAVVSVLNAPKTAISAVLLGKTRMSGLGFPLKSNAMTPYELATYEGNSPSSFSKLLEAQQKSYAQLYSTSYLLIEDKQTLKVVEEVD